MRAWVGTFLLLVPLPAWGHPGGLDAKGCHTHRETGEYHCHRGKGAAKGSKAKRSRKAPCSSAGWSSRTVRVTKVFDGDTIEVRAGSDHAKVRVLGIDCPESKRNRKCMRDGKAKCEAQIPRGKKATRRAKELLQGQTAKLEDAEKCDVFGRVLAYVRLEDGRDFGLTLIRQGLCQDFGWKYPHPRGNEYATETQH